jgi:hypothetical protein
MLGVAYVTKEMILLRWLSVCISGGPAGNKLENLFYLLVGQAVMNFFVIMLGVTAA